jgi:hypothetical protein
MAKPKNAKRSNRKPITSQYEPSDEERTQLGQILDLPGFVVLQKIAIAACAEFRDVVFLLNPMDPNYHTMTVEAARRANTAMSLWEGIAVRIEKQATILRQPKNAKGKAPTPGEALPDRTTRLLELLNNGETGEE